ncbi:YdeI/OmpD-associated family protein [Dyadobacter sp. 22481]
MIMNTKVDAYVVQARQWRDVIEQLRTIALDCGLTEEFKWGKPCYSFEGTNIVVIQGFKAYCALLFMKGYLLSDPENVLIKTGENTKVGRQIRFETAQDVLALEPVLRAYIREAVQAEQSGLKVEIDKSLPAPTELQDTFDEIPALKKAFDALTPGRQRAYIIYFSASKQSQTRQLRIEKSIERILNGKGLND